MSDILCRWLNDELRLSQVVEPKTFAKNFSSGYLIGEILHKYQLQNDFNTFTKTETSISKLSNFTRLEPTLQLLGISFNVNTAQELMQEKQGAATHLLYQLYVSLEKKKKAQIGRRVMEIMQPAASVGLHKKECDNHSDRLQLVVKHDAELKLQKIFQHSDEKWQQLNERSVMIHPIQQQIQPKVQDSHRVRITEKAAVVQVPKPPPSTSQLRLKRRMHQQQRKAQQAQSVQTEIAQFETNKKKLVTYGFDSSSSGKPPGDLPLGGGSQGCNIPGSGAKLVLQSNSKYIQDIRQRLRENAVAREQRQKRLDRYLVEQLKAHKAQEEARREEQLVKRLTRQTQQEQRLAAQLLQMRGQKEVMRQNRLLREQQHRERRERDFQEAMESEAALAQQVKLERGEEIRKELEFSNRTAAERAQSRYKKRFGICKDILEQIVDLATKVGEYRLLTGNLIPGKLMREWKELLFSGLPLYELSKGQPGSEFSAPADPVELQKQEILNNQDYDEYTNMVGGWAWPEDTGETKLPPANNNILGHVIGRLRSIVHQPSMEPPFPSFPHFTLKACVLGKFCSGKSTCLAKIAKGQGICVLSADTLIEDALNAYKNAEEVAQQQEGENGEQLLMSSTSLKPALETHEESRDTTEITLSARALHGATVEKDLRRGNAIPNELLVNIIVEAIRQIPAQSSWILDGFPLDITQAQLLEKALGGAVEVETAVVNTRANLAADPNPPEPPPPTPALDLVLLLDVPDECVVRRAFSHTDKASAAAAASCSTDKTLYLAQIQQRITAFQDSWPKLERWFGAQQSILTRVDADVEEEELYKRVESVLQRVMKKTEDALAPSVEEGGLNSQKASDSFSSATPPPVDQPPHLKEETSGLTESHSSLNEDKAPSVTSLPTSSSPKGHSRKVSTSSVTQENFQGIPNNPPEAASPCPGSPSWVYVDEPIPPVLPESLCSHWDAACDSFVNNVKTVMQQLRSQRSSINHHLYNIREEYKHYLGRPGLKQEFVSRWQRDFNSLRDDMRDDEEMKAELHLRLDELCERLWDVSEQRREEDEREKAALMSEGWLEEHAAVLINHHSILTQVELDRLQATLCVLRVYYLSMYNQVLPEQHSNFGCIPLLNTPEIENQDKSTEPMGASVDDKKDKRKSSLHPDISAGVSKMKGQAQTEPVKPALEKLISDYEEVFSGISKLVSAEAQQMETKEPKEKMQETNLPKASGSAKKARRQSSKKQKGRPSPHPDTSPAPDDDKNSEKTHDQEVKKKIHKEYAAALDHEDNAAKVRVTLVKGHGLAMVQSLQSRAEQTVSSMQQWLETHYLAEMKSIDQLAEVVRHHIEAGAKLQNELVLECTDFYLNGGYRMVASPPPPPRPPSLEKPLHSTPTIIQLESLHRQLCTVAPSGFMSSLEFLTLLKDIISVHVGNALPEPWISKTEAQVLGIVSLLKDDYDLIDWRRFLLSAALPWPFPSLTQLLALLQRFRAADIGNTGYVNEEQYLQTELWFSNDSVQPVPEDPSEPLPYDRLANLHKFFFKLFADQSVSPPCLDYVSMLRYFAADSHPRQGFIRALSVVLGQHLKLSSPGHLVQSMATIGEAAELCSELDREDKEEETPCASTTSACEQDVSIPALLDVICHKITKMKDGSPLPPGCPSQEEHTEHLVQIFSELGYKPEDHVPISVLSHHPFIQGLMETSTNYQLVDIHRVLLSNQDEGEPDSLTLS